MHPLINYQFITEYPQALPGMLYQYLVGANGVFVSAKNQVFEAVIPITTIRDQGRYIRGLEVIIPRLKLARRVPARVLQHIIKLSRAALPNEVLFYLSLDDWDWYLETPAQVNGQGFVKPLEDICYVPIEVHSHNTMPAKFSGIDNKDETGLRIYGVIGRVDQPIVDMKLRVSIYGHWATVPYQLVFESVSEVRDGID